MLSALGIRNNGFASFALTMVFGALVVVLTMLVARLARHLSRSASRNALWDVQLVLLVGRAVYIGVLILGFLAFVEVVAPQWLAAVVGFVGLLGLAFGLAFQDILKNWISGVFLLLERPFRIGDEITVNNFTGTVETVRLRVTDLRTADGQRVLVPNQQVYTSVIVDSSSFPFRQFTLVATLAPDRSLAEALRSAGAAVRAIDGVAAEPPPEVSLVPHLEYGATIEARVWVDVQAYRVRTVQRQVNAALLAVATDQEVKAGDLGVAAGIGDPRRPAPPAAAAAKRPGVPRLPVLSATGKKKQE
ncbi:MAG: mechanosensitive ion channel family protein [Candidatus Dormibacteria bacterium]